MRTLLAALVLSIPAAGRAAIPAPAAGVWRAPLQAALLAAQPAPTQVSIVIDHSLPDRATITDPRRDIDVELEGFGSLLVSGTLNGSLFPRLRGRSWQGVDLLGQGVNVGASPFGGTAFILSGLYTKADGSRGDLDIDMDAGFPPLRDLWIRQRGLDLTARWQATGYILEGTADSKLYDNKALQAIAVSIAGLTWDAFRLP